MLCLFGYRMPEEGQGSHTVEQEPLDPVEDHAVSDERDEDVMEVLFENNMALENRVTKLEQENATHQFTETQYKELAYQAQNELAEMKIQLQEQTTLATHMVAKNAELREILEQEHNKFAILSIEHQALHLRFDLEIANRIRVEDA